MKFNLRARLAAEFLGSAFLVAAVIGSGIMGERLAAGNVAIALLANTIATGAALLSVRLMSRLSKARIVHLRLLFRSQHRVQFCPEARCGHNQLCHEA
jgi:hypothetical protein